MPPPGVDDWRETLIVDAALETGLVAALDRGVGVREAAGLCGLDQRAAAVVSAALADFGYLRADGSLTDRGQKLLRPESGGADRAAGFALGARAIRSHLELAETLRTGAPRDDVSAGDEHSRRRFAHAMRDRAADRVEDVVRALPPPRSGARLLDVGGAPGSYAIPFAEADWAVTVFDLPHAIELMRTELEDAGVEPVGGDLHDGLPVGPWDAVYLGNVTHLFSAGDAEALVLAAGAEVADGGTLAVQEVVRGLSVPGHVFAVMMLVSTPAGDTFTEAQYREWMQRARCPLDRVVALSAGWHHLLVGRRFS